jgi:hypothetical protein
MLDTYGDQKLPDVALNMLGGVEEQAEVGRRQLLPSDAAKISQRLLVRCPQLFQCAIDLPVEVPRQSHGRDL